MAPTRRAPGPGRGRIDSAKSWFDLWTFETNGVLTVALALAGLAAGALAGVVVRRALPALMLGLGLTAGVWTLARLLMPHLWPAVTQVTALGQGYGQHYSTIQVGQGLVTANGGHVPQPVCYALSPADCGTAAEKLGAVGFYSQYHPVSHYWPLQLTTSALVLALAAVATTAAYAVLRRRTA
ncbi:hypothetical protein [Streptomyces sp. NPDC006012]|uniref:hypothetical protein n=1 Tax=Streptomyces sp. NPDC006012 TaxID=3364739 RepID=UPI0036C7D623